jgi:RimJ/RimL family protein N-acetyltransferase
MTSLVPITRDNWRDALDVRVQPERLSWVATSDPVGLILLAKCAVRPDGQEWFPFLFLDDDDQTVGVIGVGIAGDAAWLHHVLIDVHAQGRGYGRAQLTELARWVQAEHPEVTRLGLNVAKDNATAWRLYSSLGFEVVGTTIDGQSITMSYLDEVAA